MVAASAAIKNWEAAAGVVAAEETHVKLYCQMPPINKMDSSLSTLAACERLALSTNNIDKINPLTGLTNLKILSLGRNSIKKIEKLEDIAGTLEELWISYNQISTLDGIGSLPNLEVLYLGNNTIKHWTEVDKLRDLPKLRDLLLFGNPIYDEFDKAQARIGVIKRLPDLAKLDGDMVKPGERELATQQLAGVEA